MQNNENENEEVGKNPANENYLEEIKKLKENTVSKEEYEKVLGENKKLLEEYIQGNPQASEEQKEEEKSLEELTAFMKDDSLTNLDYVKGALELRAEMIKRGKPDPFVPAGNKYVPTDDDFEAAERVAKGLQEMVDIADGDPNVFMNEYQRRVVDTAPAKKKR